MLLINAESRSWKYRALCSDLPATCCKGFGCCWQYSGAANYPNHKVTELYPKALQLGDTLHKVKAKIHSSITIKQPWKPYPPFCWAVIHAEEEDSKHWWAEPKTHQHYSKSGDTTEVTGIKKNEAEDEIYFCPVEYTAFSSLLFFQGREEEQECNLCGSDACLLWRGHTPNLQLPQIRQCQQGWEQSPGLLCQQVLHSHCTWQRKKKKRKKRVEKCLPEAVVRFSVEILKWLARKARLPYRDQLLHLVKFFEEQRNTR